MDEQRRDAREERRREGENPARAARSPAELVGTPPPGTAPGGQNAGAATGAQPADPEEAEEP